MMASGVALGVPVFLHWLESRAVPVPAQWVFAGTVFMLGLEQGVIPGYGETTPALKREPRRLFYVGLTRARYEVHMLYSGWRESPYGRKSDGPSEFLLARPGAMTPSTAVERTDHVNDPESRRSANVHGGRNHPRRHELRGIQRAER